MNEQETIAVTTDAEQPGSEQTRVERLVMPIPCEFSYTRQSRMDPAKRTVHEGIMGVDEKLKRALADDWEFVGDPWQLCQILRAEVHRLQAKIQLAECQHLGCGGRLTPDEVVTAMRDVLKSEA